MADQRSSLRALLTRAAVAAGALAILLALALRNVSEAAWRSPLVLTPLLAGAALLLGALLANWRRVEGILQERRFRIGLNVWATVLLSAILLIVVNAIVAGTPQTYGWLLDATRERLHTLSGQTRKILGALNQDVRITVLMGAGEVPIGNAGKMEVGARVQDLARLYRAASDRVRVDVVDAYVEKLRVEQTALRLKAKVEPDTILIECGGRRVQAPFSDLVELPPMATPYDSPDPKAIGFRGEERLSAAILLVTEGKQPTAYFLTGHGEMAPDGAEGKALNRFATELRRVNYLVRPLNLMQTRTTPDDADLIVVAGPAAPLEADEVRLLRAYLEKNGTLLVLARPRAARGNLSGMDRLLIDYNVQVADNELAIEVYRSAAGNDVADIQVIIQSYGAHPITDEMKTINCVMSTACPVKAATPPPVMMAGRTLGPSSPYAVTTLISSSDRSWGETNVSVQPVTFNPKEDEKGPLSLAVAVERRTAPPLKPPVAGPRLVVVGSLNAASDAALLQYEGNRMFLMNCVNWLGRKESRLGIPPQRHERREFTPSPAALKAVFLITVILMPLTTALVGGWVWWARRR